MFLPYSLRWWCGLITNAGAESISSTLIKMINNTTLNMQALVANPSTSSTMDLEKMQSLEVGTAPVQLRLNDV